ncbi:uncharacterized protein LOC141589979 [Silene latifolia]|uniref:uncharacterized protein LOC141589979 n=1 Tax=Silene latifolia TaxID=37657 RepID=UPI003D78A357
MIMCKGVRDWEYLNIFVSVKDQIRIVSSSKAFCKRKLWQLPRPHTWKILVCKILSSTLPLGDEFARRNIFMDYNCSLCKDSNSIESLNHLFRDCVVVKRLWASYPLGINADHANFVHFANWLIKCFSYFSSLDDSSTPTSLFFSVLWSIWCTRNNIIFRGDTLSVDFFHLQFNSAQSAISALNHLSSPVLFGRPGEDDDLCALKENILNSTLFHLMGVGSNCQVIRAKVDESWVHSLHASCGWVVYRGNGVCLNRSSYGFLVETALEAEAIRICDLLTWAISSNYLHLDVSSDCLQILLQITWVDRPHHKTLNNVKDINLLLMSYHCICFSFIPRNLNKVGHNLDRNIMGL